MAFSMSFSCSSDLGITLFTRSACAGVCCVVVETVCRNVRIPLHQRLFVVAFFAFVSLINSIADGSNVAILPVVTKNLSSSPRFTPYDFSSRCKFSTLTTRQPMVEFYLLTCTNAFRYERKNKNPALTRIELTSCALAGVQVTY